MSAPAPQAASLPAPRASHALLAVAVIALSVLLVAFRLGAADLIEPDEGRYAQVGAGMAESGDWVVPRLLGLPYLEKPPLGYWLTAASMCVLGETALAARLVPAVSALLAALAAFWLAARLSGRRAGLLAALALALSPLHAALARTLTLDMTFGALVALALACYVEATRGPRRSSIFGMYALGALATLAKGPAGVVLIAGPVALDVALSPLASWGARIRALRLVSGAIVFLAIAAPWYVLIERRLPGAARFFIVEENFERFLTDRSNRNGYLWFFFPVVVGGFFPWILFAGGPARDAIRAARARADHAALVPLLAAGFGFVFFSISRSQLPPYMTPVAPAIAALAGIGLDRFLDAGPRPGSARAAWLGGFVATMGAGAAAVGGFFAWRGAPIHPEIPVAANVWILACGAVLLACGAVAAIALRRGRRAAGVGVLAAGMAGALLVSSVALEEVAPLLSCAPFEPDLRGRPADETLITFWVHPDGIELYAKGAIVHVVPSRPGYGDPYAPPVAELKNPLGSDLWSCARFGGEAARRTIVYGDEPVCALGARLAAAGRPFFVLLSEKRAESGPRWLPAELRFAWAARERSTPFLVLLSMSCGEPDLVRVAGERRLLRFGG